jgi:hypothetical protein
MGERVALVEAEVKRVLPGKTSGDPGPALTEGSAALTGESGGELALPAIPVLTATPTPDATPAAAFAPVGAALAPALATLPDLAPAASADVPPSSEAAAPLALDGDEPVDAYAALRGVQGDVVDDPEQTESGMVKLRMYIKKSAKVGSMPSATPAAVIVNAAEDVPQTPPVVIDWAVPRFGVREENFGAKPARVHQRLSNQAIAESAHAVAEPVGDVAAPPDAVRGSGAVVVDGPAAAVAEGDDDENALERKNRILGELDEGGINAKATKRRRTKSVWQQRIENRQRQTFGRKPRISCTVSLMYSLGSDPLSRPLGDAAL